VVVAEDTVQVQYSKEIRVDLVVEQEVQDLVHKVDLVIHLLSVPLKEMTAEQEIHNQLKVVEVLVVEER
tara:strand:+ start:365 stop:571 length:207 start_codon:yes stop_codon:yes gene_type:complete